MKSKNVRRRTFTSKIVDSALADGKRVINGSIKSVSTVESRIIVVYDKQQTSPKIFVGDSVMLTVGNNTWLYIVIGVDSNIITLESVVKYPPKKDDKVSILILSKPEKASGGSLTLSAAPKQPDV